MGYILLCILIVEAILIFFFNGKNLISPSFIACAVFIFSTIMYLTSPDYYGYSLHFNTVIVITVLLFCLFLGEIFVKSINHGKKLVRIKESQKPVVIPVYLTLVLAGVVGVFGVLYFLQVYRYSLTVGNTSGNFLTMAKFVRDDGKFSKSFLISQGTLLSECILYFAVYYYFFNKITSGKRYYRYLLIILCYVPHILATDNRTNLLKAIAVSCIIAFFLIKQGSLWSRKKDKIIIVISVLMVAVFILLFRLLGYRTETSIRNSDPWINVVKYTSSSLVGIDQYLNGMLVSEKSVLFGERTLRNIYNLLREWGFSIPEISSVEGFFQYVSAESNIYTGFKAYIQDYGYFGAGLSIFLWGAVVMGLLCRLKYKKVSFIGTAYLGIIFYPVIMLSISDVTATVLGISSVYSFVYLAFLEILAHLFAVKKKTKVFNLKGARNEIV